MNTLSREDLETCRDEAVAFNEKWGRYLDGYMQGNIEDLLSDLNADLTRAEEEHYADNPPRSQFDQHNTLSKSIMGVR